MVRCMKGSIVGKKKSDRVGDLSIKAVAGSKGALSWFYTTNSVCSSWVPFSCVRKSARRSLKLVFVEVKVTHTNITWVKVLKVQYLRIWITAVGLFGACLIVCILVLLHFFCTMIFPSCNRPESSFKRILSLFTAFPIQRTHIRPNSKHTCYFRWQHLGGKNMCFTLYHLNVLSSV